MALAPVIDDLFGHVPQRGAAQSDLEDGAERPSRHFDVEADYLVPTPDAPAGGHTPESIRTQVTKIMTVVREAESQPFGGHELHSHNVWMPYLCEWLKGGEGDRLLIEYRERMRAFGVDPVVPKAKLGD